LNKERGSLVQMLRQALNIINNEYRTEIDYQKQLLEDFQLSQSIAQAVFTDAALLNELATQDLQAYEDRSFAIQLSREDAEYAEYADLPGCDPTKRLRSRTGRQPYPRDFRLVLLRALHSPTTRQTKLVRP
jgi:hypothetical protein